MTTVRYFSLHFHLFYSMLPWSNLREKSTKTQTDWLTLNDEVDNYYLTVMFALIIIFFTKIDENTRNSTTAVFVLLSRRLGHLNIEKDKRKCSDRYWTVVVQMVKTPAAKATCGFHHQQRYFSRIFFVRNYNQCEHRHQIIIVEWEICHYYKDEDTDLIILRSMVAMTCNSKETFFLNPSRGKIGTFLCCAVELQKEKWSGGKFLSFVPF